LAVSVRKPTTSSGARAIHSVDSKPAISQSPYGFEGWATGNVRYLGWSFTGSTGKYTSV
jgi:hypothetical protein